MSVGIAQPQHIDLFAHAPHSLTLELARRRSMPAPQGFAGTGTDRARSAW
ncbi:hypothetical protein JNC05_22640 [Paraburkholderia ginsengiterrae]|nr:hypothetical protein [Paraburkholderia ginsengiterrae]